LLKAPELQRLSVTVEVLSVGVMIVGVMTVGVLSVGVMTLSLFFIIFINDIVTEIHSSIKLFAGDTSLYVIVDNPRESAITLNNDMATIHAWSTKWLVNFNPQKTETMTITRKINKPFHPPLIMNNTIINQVTEHKHLDLEISNDDS
jgi:hypothetical protein